MRKYPKDVIENLNRLLSEDAPAAAPVSGRSKRHSNEGFPPEEEIGPALKSVNRELDKEGLPPITHDHYRVIFRGPPGHVRKKSVAKE